MVASDISSNGWFQGSALDAATLRSIFEGMDVNPDDVGIVITHSCDLRHHDLDAEPYVEVAIGEKLDDCSLEYMNLRHPRVLDVRFGSGESYRFSAKKIKVFLRENLAKLKPSGVVRVADALDLILRWRSNRVLRVARPDDFNRTISLRRKDLVRWLKKANPIVREIRVRFDPIGELRPGQRYKAQFILLMDGRPGNVDQDTILSRLALELSIILEDCGIDPYGNYDIVTFGYLDEITVSEYREFLLFDMGDYLSAEGREYVW